MDAILRVACDVVIVTSDERELIAIAREPGVLDEALVVDVPDQVGRAWVRVVDSRPTVVEGAVRHALRLHVVRGFGGEATHSSLGDAAVSDLAAAYAGVGTGRFAVLTRECQARLLNCSWSGCLMETNVALTVGTIASLGVLQEGRGLTDHVQVVRCQQIAGAGSLQHVGARFLLTNPLDDRTIRKAFGRPPHD